MVSDGVNPPEKVFFFSIDYSAANRAVTSKRPSFGTHFINMGDKNVNPLTVTLKTPIWADAGQYSTYLKLRDKYFKLIENAKYLIVGNRALHVDGIRSSKQTTTNYYDHTDSQNEFILNLANPYWQDVNYNLVTASLSTGANVVNIDTLGDVACYPILKIFNANNLQTFSFILNSRTFTYDNLVPLVAADELYIDTENGLTLFNGLDYRDKISNGSQFIEFEPSTTNSITVNLDAAAEIEIKYKNSWRL